MVHHSVLLFLQGLHDTLEFLENSWIFENFYQALERYLKFHFGINSWEKPFFFQEKNKKVMKTFLCIHFDLVTCSKENWCEILNFALLCFVYTIENYCNFIIYW